MTILEKKMKRTTKKLVEQLESATEAVNSNESTKLIKRNYIFPVGLKKDTDLCLKASELKHNISTKMNDTIHSHDHSKRSYAVTNA
ncbi:MAG: hypothetical protein Q8S22_07235 [Eubacteriales bacterium]|jgi:hypothetical protein|nr:hypothetical protein [Eubacteriales bacterium]